MSAKIIGFDMGEKNLKMVYMAGGEVKKSICAEMPDSMVADGQIVAADAMSAFISETAKKNGIPKGDAAIILPPSQTYVRTITVPVMSEHQLSYNLPYEFKDYLTEEKNKYIYDYEVLETISDEEGNPKEMRLFVCAILKDLIERMRVTFARAGYRLKVAVPEEYVYAKLFRMGEMSLLPQEGLCAIVDFGQAETRMHILVNGEYDNKRTFDIGVQAIEHIIADAKFTDVHMAHNYILQNYEDCQNDPKCVELYNQIAIELLKAVNFCNYNNPDTELTELYVIGGGAAIEPLIDIIRQVTKLNIHFGEEILNKKMGAEDPAMTLRAVSAAAEA